MNSLNFAEASAKLAAIRRELEANEARSLKERPTVVMSLTGVYRTDADSLVKGTGGSLPLGWLTVTQGPDETPAKMRKRALAEAKELMALWDRTLAQVMAKQKEIAALGKNIPFGYDYKMGFEMDGPTKSDRPKSVNPLYYQTATLELRTADKFGYWGTIATFTWDRDSGKWSGG